MNSDRNQDIDLTRASGIFKRGSTLGVNTMKTGGRMSMDEENDLLGDFSLMGVADSSPFMSKKKGALK
jgi:hypothetical protein